MQRANGLAERIFRIAVQKYGHLELDWYEVEYSFDLAYIYGKSYIILDKDFFELPPKVRHFIKRMLFQELKASESC